jgi:hypothetical protein
MQVFHFIHIQFLHTYSSGDNNIKIFVLKILINDPSIYKTLRTLSTLFKS